MMNDKLEVFVDCILHYFNTLSKDKASVGTPFLIKDVNKNLSDYTGIISISGSMKGSIFFTATHSMLVYLLQELGSIGTQESKLMDLVGEIGNTISGNTRAEFGEQFLLSVPLVLKGKGDQMMVSNTFEIYAIPIVWRQHSAMLIINIGE